MLPIQIKELMFMIANIFFLKGDFMASKLCTQKFWVWTWNQSFRVKFWTNLHLHRLRMCLIFQNLKKHLQKVWGVKEVSIIWGVIHYRILDGKHRGKWEGVQSESRCKSFGLVYLAWFIEEWKCFNGRARTGIFQLALSPRPR